MFEYGDDIRSLVYHHNIEEWCFKNSNEFLRAFSDLISEKKYVDEIALSIAHHAFEGERSCFLDDNNLSDVQALCYLHTQTDSYYEDIREAYQEYLSDQVDTDE